MTTELFVYWRAAPAEAEAAIAAARDFQRALCRDHPGLATRLYRRSDAERGLVTVMETYCAAAGVAEEVQELVRSAGWCPGERHVERFEPIA